MITINLLKMKKFVILLSLMLFGAAAAKAQTWAVALNLGDAVELGTYAVT